MSNPVVKPYNQSSKKEEVEQMFDNIAHKYDFLNHFFSLGIDILWRKRAIRLIKKTQPKTILDVATGTGDFAILTAKQYQEVDSITGIDISEGMLEVGRKKIKEKSLDQKIAFKNCRSSRANGKLSRRNCFHQNAGSDCFTLVGHSAICFNANSTNQARKRGCRLVRYL